MFDLIWVFFWFRVVNEVHSSATKKNKEWQETLPIVILKAEEILYSKPDSVVLSLLSLSYLLIFCLLHQCHLVMLGLGLFYCCCLVLKLSNILLQYNFSLCP